MQVLAGQIAESLINTNDEHLERGSKDDVETAMRLAMLALGPDVDFNELTTYVVHQHEDMWRVLTPLFPTVIRVANYLITHLNEEVPGETLKGLIQDAPVGAAQAAQAVGVMPWTRRS